MMQDIDNHGRPRTLEERLAEVQSLTVDGLRDYLKQYPIDAEGFTVSVGPRPWPQQWRFPAHAESLQWRGSEKEQDLSADASLAENRPDGRWAISPCSKTFPFAIAVTVEAPGLR